ncbi:MAG TPA: hypothetical protein VGS11_11320 [Candidatus Bathyarchaeia archaeon]|nr:hypothetical protein [Candidatus Bathyarchaeia archaeon]
MSRSSLYSPFFEFGTKPFGRLTGKYRLEMLEEAAREGIDTIFTFVYGKSEDDKFVKNDIQRVTSHSEQVCLVRLYCDRIELVRRVKASQRRRMGKVGSEKLLSDLFQRHNLDSEIPSRASLSIDTTDRTPINVAKTIVRHYKLQSSSPRPIRVI